MKNNFITVSPYDLKGNVMKMLDNDWMLITAGNMDHFNTMTASWGGFGILWHKPVAFIFVRPQRYTFEFTENNEFFTLCFFDDKYRDVLNYCGTHSGKDVDKIAKTGLAPTLSENNGVYFEQARLVIECRKIYYDDIDPANFLDEKINRNYPTRDYHRMYIGEIISCLAKPE